MSIKKGKKQVYKVEHQHKFLPMDADMWETTKAKAVYYRCKCGEIRDAAPLKPKKSIKKMEGRKTRLRMLVPFDIDLPVSRNWRELTIKLSYRDRDGFGLLIDDTKVWAKLVKKVK